MREVSRRSVLQGCMGATVGVVGFTETTSAIPDTEKPDYYAIQAEFVKKFVEKIDQSFRTYADIFNPPTNEELVNLFVESLTPSLATMIPYIKQVAELKETLEWYENVGDESMFSLIADKGVSTDGVLNFRGSNGDAMENANSEVKAIFEQCEVVADRAEACSNNPSESATANMVAGMETLTTKLDGLEWVQRWANMDPGAYQNVAKGTSGAREKTIDRIQNNAQAVLDIAAATREDVVNKTDTMADGDILPLPAAIVKYNNTISDIRSQASGWAFNRVAGDSFQIITQDESGTQMTVRWINTESNGQIDEFEVVEQDSANADLIISETVREDIMSAEETIATAQAAYNNGKVELSGNGIFNQMKYDGGEFLAKHIFN